MNFIRLVVAASILFAVMPVQAQSEFDYHQIKLTSSKFEAPGSIRITNGRKASVGNVYVIIEDFQDKGKEIEDQEILRGHWGKYYFQGISDNPDTFQPELKPVLSSLLTKIGIEVISSDKSSYVADLYFMIHLDDNLVAPTGYRPRNGAWIFSKASEVYLKSSVILNVRPIGSVPPSSVPYTYGIDISVSQSVLPKIGGGLSSIGKSYTGYDLLKFPQFVISLNSCMDSLIQKGVSKLVMKLDEESVYDMWRNLSRKR